MIRSRVIPVVAALIVSSAAVFAQKPSDDEIRKILTDRLHSPDLGIGIVVGIIDAKGRRVFAFGGLAKNDSRRLDGDTVFEIGSITKEVTSLLLTDMARRGDVALTDPVSRYLPEGVTVPERNARKITLADLSTHSSGLPRMPSNLRFSRQTSTTSRRRSRGPSPTNSPSAGRLTEVTSRSDTGGAFRQGTAAPSSGMAARPVDTGATSGSIPTREWESSSCRMS